MSPISPLSNLPKPSHLTTAQEKEKTTIQTKVDDLRPLNITPQSRTQLPSPTQSPASITASLTSRERSIDTDSDNEITFPSPDSLSDNEPSPDASDETSPREINKPTFVQRLQVTFTDDEDETSNEPPINPPPTAAALEAIEKMHASLSSRADKKWLARLEMCFEQSKNSENKKKLIQSTQSSGALGSSGSYFVRKHKEVDGTLKPSGKIAIDKPFDQELSMPHSNKPGGLKARDGMEPGEGVLRERAAYELFPELVPCTILEYVPGTLYPPPRVPYAENELVLVSRQRIVSNIQDLGALKKKNNEDYQKVVGTLSKEFCAKGVVEKEKEWAGELFNRNKVEKGTQIAINEIHRMAFMDISLVNTDRNGGNILIDINQNKEGKFGLHLCDHGCCLCEGFKDPVSLIWMKWPGSHVPIDTETKTWMLKKLEENNEKMKSVIEMMETFAPTGDRTELLKTTTVCNAILKSGIEAGLTPYQMGCLVAVGFAPATSVAHIIYEKAKAAEEEGENFTATATKLAETVVKAIAEKAAKTALTQEQIDTLGAAIASPESARRRAETDKE